MIVDPSPMGNDQADFHGYDEAGDAVFTLGAYPLKSSRLREQGKYLVLEFRDDMGEWRAAAFSPRQRKDGLAAPVRGMTFRRSAESPFGSPVPLLRLSDGRLMTQDQYAALLFRDGRSPLGALWRTVSGS